MTGGDKRSEAYWKSKLNAEQYYVLREKGTERPFSGALLMNKKQGIYCCAACGNELFTDKMKFDSHCGWPSFDKEIEGGKINKTIDKTLGMIRTEITCAKCNSHLGHIFDDGPTETGLRYCVNSISMEFIPHLKSEVIQMITLGGGCFWCIEAVFQKLKGILLVESGYSGGFIKNPAYREVCNGNTGHAEVVNITFDSNEITLHQILEVFFAVHDPTTLNRQGNDIGTQYRSVIYYHNKEQQDIVEQVIQRLNDEKVFAQPIVTEIKAFQNFYKAEAEHQNYYELHKEQPYCQIIILPKIEKLSLLFKALQG
ncbi:MAG TPA: bifunctional methionine sulfoxide reductase B/A protein [Bacteroidia bacterium]|nr:bifunctional methionine sulfoxide reductase B/A protein [Bacteroidia bacterium]